MTLTVWYIPWMITQLPLSHVVTTTNRWQLTITLSLSQARCDRNTWALSLRSNFSPPVTAHQVSVVIKEYIQMDPDYSNYDLTELLEARESIDRNAHIHRYFKICQEIDARVIQPKEIQRLNSRNNFSKLVFVKVIFSLLSIFFTHKLFIEFTDSYISWRGKTNYYAQQSPDVYYLLVAVNVFFLLFCVYLVVTNRWANKLNT